MRRHMLATVLFAGVLLAPLARGAQDAVTAAAEREETEVRYKTIIARMESIDESLIAVRKNQSRLSDEMRSLREEIDRLKSNKETAALQSDARRLAEKIEEVDRKRISDNERTLSILQGLKQGILERPSPVRTPTPPVDPPRHNPPATNAPPAGNTPGYHYVIRERDTLSKIVADLRKAGWKISEQQIRDANPTVNWNRIIPGKKIFIPAPPQ